MVSISFEYNNEIINFNGNNSVDIFKNISDWLYKNGYDFKSESSNSRSIYTRAQIIENNYPISRFHKIQGSSLYIPTTMTGNISVRVKNIILMLKNFGIDEKSIKTEGLPVITTTPKIKRFGQIEISDDIQNITDEDEMEDIENEKIFSKNPFGGIENSSAVCILGKSGSGKSTSTEIALEEMGHEYELMLAIDGEYTFSQYNGQNFEMSSFGEFLMRAQNDPKKCYTAIFDECHRPITINKINTDLLQALSRKRNRDGKRFITMDRSTKRMYTTPNEEFPIALTEKTGKILIPDNFGIICLSSNAAIICRNDDFLNRVDLIIFHQSDRDIKDLTQLKKLEPNDKNIETIRGLLLNDGKSEL